MEYIEDVGKSKIVVVRWIRSENLVYSTMIIVDNMYNLNMRVELYDRIECNLTSLSNVKANFLPIGLGSYKASWRKKN